MSAHFRSVGLHTCGPGSSRSWRAVKYRVLHRLGRITLMRIPRQFMARTPEEQSWLQKNTWCERCARPDLGMKERFEYEEDKTIYIEGSASYADRRCDLASSSAT